MSVVSEARKLYNRKIRNRASYKNCFLTPSGEMVLHDLYKFCRVGTSTLDTDAIGLAIIEGRRSVFIRILHNMKVHDERKELQRLEEIENE